MKFLQFKSNHLLGALLALTAVAFLVTGCREDDDMMPSDSLIASFQYTVDANDFLTVSFTNFSQNATSYDWDFGDGNTSTDEDPTHTYAAPGTYTVTLTASDDEGNTADRSETLEITDPGAVLSLLTGDDSKTWYLLREGIALGIGPAVDDNQWWSFGGATPLGDRPCILDDQYIFHRDGTFEFNSNGTLFVDSEANGGWLPDEGCVDESEPNALTGPMGEDLSAFANGGDYNFELNTTESTLTLNGEGAYIGLCNKTVDGDNYNPVSTKTYQVFNLVEGDIADTLGIALVNPNGDFVWNFYLVSYEDENDLPDIPTAVPAANFTTEVDGLTVTFNNSSNNSTSYSWDFGDGGSSMDENPTHTYAAEGTYTVTLTASDDMGNSDEFSADVTVSQAVFTPDVLSNADGKVWKLIGEASYYVGSFEGGNDYWGGLDAAGVMERSCQMDDEFIFTDGGNFEFDSKGDLFDEGYMMVGMNSCIDEADLAAPFDVFASTNTHSFSVVDAMGDDPATITVSGDGAFIGWNKPSNEGEIGTDQSTPSSSITYNVFNYAKIGNTETLTLTLQIPNGAWWTIVVESVN